jgi:hypothetical protein
MFGRQKILSTVCLHVLFNELFIDKFGLLTFCLFSIYSNNFNRFRDGVKFSKISPYCKNKIMKEKPYIYLEICFFFK